MTTDTDVATEVAYSWLDGSALAELAPTFEARGWTPLTPEVSRALVARNTDGRLLGFLVMQLVPHTEPLYVEPNARGAEIAAELSRQMAEWLRSEGCSAWWAHADSVHAAKLCEANGMVKVESPVFKGGV